MPRPRRNDHPSPAAALPRGSAFTKDIARTVRGTLKRFVALAVITALGVTMLTGLKASCDDLRRSADAFFDEQGLFDIRVQSTLGLTDEDIDALAALDGVEAAEGGYAETVYTQVGATTEKVDLRALSDSGMNEPLVVEGHLPERDDQIAVTERFLRESGLSVGDALSFHGESDEDAKDATEAETDGLESIGDTTADTEIFERKDYIITAAVYDVMNINGGEEAMNFRASGGANYTFFVTIDNVIDPDVYTVAYLIIEGADAPLCYSDDYDRIVDEVKQTVEDARSERERARGEGLRADATAEIDEAEAEAVAELADAERELDEGQAALDENLFEVLNGKLELETQRADALGQLADAQGTIDANRITLRNALQQLEDGERQLAQGWATYYAELPSATRELEEGQAALNQARQDFQTDTLAPLEELRNEAQNAVDTLPATIAQIDGTVSSLTAGLRSLAENIDATMPGAGSGFAKNADELDTAWSSVQSADKSEADSAAANFQQAIDDTDANFDSSLVTTMMQTLNRQIASAEKTALAYKDQVDDLDEELAGYDTTLAQKRIELSALKDQLSAMDENDPAYAETEAAYQRTALEISDIERKHEIVQGQRDDAQEKYRTAETELENLKSQYQGITDLNSGIADLASAESESAPNATALAHGRIQAAASLEQAKANLPLIEAGIVEAKTTAEQEFAQAQATIDNGWAALDAGREALEANQQTLEESRSALADGQTELAAGQAELDAQRSEALAQLADAQAQLDDALAQIADGQAELDEGRATFEEERADALDQIADAREQVADIPDAVWYVQDRSSLAGYASVNSDASSIEAIGTVIPVVFFVVAVLISLTTMTRMVEEERGLIGLYKALGYHRGRILSKYALYALAACLAGGIVGALCGFLVLPAIIFTIFKTMYALPALSFGFDPAQLLLAVALFAVGIVGATLLACVRELRETPASLMRPKAPRAGSRILLERIAPVWSRLGFLNKVTARNLFRYKRRLLMTVFGVAGCVALLITGFGIRDTVISLSARQYGDTAISRYDLLAVTTADDLDGVVADLEDSDDVDELVRAHIDNVTVSYGDGRETMQMIVVADDAPIADYINLMHEDGSAIELGSAGAVITKNAEQVLGVTPGSTIELQDSTLATGEVTVADISLNYLSNMVILNQSAYEEAFGEPAEENGVLATLTGSDSEQIAFGENLSEDGRLLTVVTTATLVRDFSAAFTLINTVVYVVIVLAAALSFTVVFTLSNTNISERDRELATIKVLGFRKREVHRYINKETILLTLMGIVAGMPIGYALARSLTWILKMPSLYFDVVVEPLTYVIAAVLAFVFTLMVNLITNRSLDRIDMVGALKSAE